MYPSATNCEKNASFSCRSASASCSPAHFTPLPALADKSATSTFSTCGGLSGGLEFTLSDCALGRSIVRSVVYIAHAALCGLMPRRCFYLGKAQLRRLPPPH